MVKVYCKICMIQICSIEYISINNSTFYKMKSSKYSRKIVKSWPSFKEVNLY